MRVHNYEGQRIGFRVTTPDGKSLGLRNNPNGVDYTDAISGQNGGKFSLPPDSIQEGEGDWGGIWVAPTLSAAKKYVDYMAKKHGILGCRIFIVLLGEILFEVKHSRIKTDSITFIAEIEETEVEN